MMDILSASEEFRNDYLERFPFLERDKFEELRKKEFARLDTNKQVYLDYTGGGLHADSQLTEYTELLRTSVFGNPHSVNPTSSAMTELVEAARANVLNFFSASPEEYDVIFTANATGALRLIGESFPFTDKSTFVLLSDNHNSVGGIKEFAKNSGAKFNYSPLTRPDLRIDEKRLSDQLNSDQVTKNVPNLFAYPAQSNFSGVQHSLKWISYAQTRGWTVILDASAFVPTNKLNLSEFHPDFVPLSIYKMFGLPTGVGCLLAKKKSLQMLNRPWYAGGTVVAVSTVANFHSLIDNHEGFEDGTVNYLSIAAVTIGLNFIRKIGVETIGRHVKSVTNALLQMIGQIRHSNGRHIARVYGPVDTTNRGGTINFLLEDPTGALLIIQHVEKIASYARISLRTGCFCNPGASETANGIGSADLTPFVSSTSINKNEIFQHLRNSGKNIGSIRISVGIATNISDIYKCIEFLKCFIDVMASEIDEVSHLISLPTPRQSPSHSPVTSLNPSPVASPRSGSPPISPRTLNRSRHSRSLSLSGPKVTSNST